MIKEGAILENPKSNKESSQKDTEIEEILKLWNERGEGVAVKPDIPTSSFKIRGRGNVWMDASHPDNSRLKRED